jgi:HEAT repeat protein
MKTPQFGSARTLLLGALSCAAVVIVVSVALMSTSGDGPSSSDPSESGGLGLPPGPGHRSKVAKPKTTGEEDDGSDDDHELVVPIPGELPDGSRDPNGPTYVVDEKSLRAVFALRHWEELRRQIDELQRDGKVVPEDVVKSLMEMLAKEDLRIDAVLVLGGVKDDATGRALAQLALSPDATVESRQAALDALAHSGQKAALPFLQQLVSSPTADEKFVRRAAFAIAAVGGDEATKTLLDLLFQHQDIGDDLHGAIVSALGKAPDSDAGMAAVMRGARDKGDKAMFQSVVVAAQMKGATIGPEFKAELQRMVESPESFTAFPNEEDRQIMQATVLPAAAAAGLVAPVLSIASTSGPMRDVALEALVNARGDAAAKLIADALTKSTDETVRWKLAKALGQTASFKATSTLVALLDDPSVNVRNMAAQSLGQIRDASAVPAMLAHLEKAAPDYPYAHALVESLGQIGANAALPALTKLAASEEEFWRQQLGPFVRNAIARIKTDNPDSMLLDDNKK